MQGPGSAPGPHSCSDGWVMVDIGEREPCRCLACKQSSKVSTKALGKGAGQQEAHASGELQEGHSQGQGSQTPTCSGSELYPQGPLLHSFTAHPREAYGRNRGPWGLWLVLSLGGVMSPHGSSPGTIRTARDSQGLSPVQSQLPQPSPPLLIPEAGLGLGVLSCLLTVS